VNCRLSSGAGISHACYTGALAQITIGCNFRRQVHLCAVRACERMDLFSSIAIEQQYSTGSDLVR
jgi:hypothetical protein